MEIYGMYIVVCKWCEIVCQWYKIYLSIEQNINHYYKLSLIFTYICMCIAKDWIKHVNIPIIFIELQDT
jgi:hypothetical protein